MIKLDYRMKNNVSHVQKEHSIHKKEGPALLIVLPVTKGHIVWKNRFHRLRAHQITIVLTQHKKILVPLEHTLMDFLRLMYHNVLSVNRGFIVVEMEQMRFNASWALIHPIRELIVV